MDPVLAQSLATLISAIATAVLMASAFYWGPSRREARRKRREEAEEDE